MRIIVTGAAGFIGFHLTKLLASHGHTLLGLDNLNNYYDPGLKMARLKKLGFDFVNGKFDEQTSNLYPDLVFTKLDVSAVGAFESAVEWFQPEMIIHLAAQAGVRYSLENPEVYVDTNVKGFFNVLEGCRKFGISKLIYASSSSVYGNNVDLPFQEIHKTDTPVSLYAATKKSNELFAYTYAHLFGIRTLGLRFFTVYGPYGRPDMAYFSFVKDIIEGKPIQVFNKGMLSRDFTYVDDIVRSIQLLIERYDSITENEKYGILNIGNSNPVTLSDFIQTIEEALGKEAIKEERGMQSGDVFSTYADVTALSALIDYKPVTKLGDGIREFVKWYKSYYNG